jgi:lipopolysaccharide-induced tumor necrosis factor-alpha factor
MAEQGSNPKMGPSAPVAYPQLPDQLPPSYDETVAGTAGGFVEPQKHEAKYQQNAYGPGAPVPPQPQHTVIVQNVHFGPRAMNMICPHCQSQIQTRTDSEPSATAWVLGVVLCILCWPLSCVPCCIDSLQDVTHTCPNCRKVVGTYKG